MGHHINAVLFCCDYDKSVAESFDMKIVELRCGVKMLCLEDDYCDFWAGKTGIQGSVKAKPLMNRKIVHFMINQVADNPRFAVIETDYHGGFGTQAAAVYQGNQMIMAPEESDGPLSDELPINRALKHLGIERTTGEDAFDRVGLYEFRDYDDMFKNYRRPIVRDSWGDGSDD